MKERDTEKLQKELAYNLIVIKTLWRSKWGTLGDVRVTGNEYNFSSLFGSIERGKETVRIYIKCDYKYKTKSISKWAERIEAKTGIPHEFLTGEQRIVLGDEFEKKYYNYYVSYLSKLEAVYKQIEMAEDGKAFDRSTTEEIKQFVKTYYSTEEQKKFFEGIKDIESMAEAFKKFTYFLAKEAEKIINADTAVLMEKNNKLCKLVYFIRFSKKYDGIGIRTIEDMQIALKNTRTGQLKQLGKKGLENYIKLLEKHLNLARSVYTVAIDIGAFEKDKEKQN